MKPKHPISRRDFLTTTAIGATGLATGCATESVALRDDKLAAAPTLESMSDAPPPSGLILHVEPMIA